jgi:MATE family multidrug resistance protein
MFLFFNRFLRLALINILSNLIVLFTGLFNVTFFVYLSRSHSSSSWRNFNYSYFFNYLYLTLEFLRIETTELTEQAV